MPEAGEMRKRNEQGMGELEGTVAKKGLTGSTVSVAARERVAEMGFRMGAVGEVREEDGRGEIKQVMEEDTTTRAEAEMKEEAKKGVGEALEAGVKNEATQTAEVGVEVVM